MKKVILSLAIAGLCLSGDCYGKRNDGLKQYDENCSLKSYIRYTEIAYEKGEDVIGVDLGSISPFECFKFYVGARIYKKKQDIYSKWRPKLETAKRVVHITFLTVTAGTATALICYNFPSVPLIAVKGLGNLAWFIGALSVASYSIKLGCKLGWEFTKNSAGFGWNFAKTKLGF